MKQQITKELIINRDDINTKNEIIVKAIEQFKHVQEQLKSYKELDKLLKEQFKKYDFQKAIIMDEKNGNITFTVTQYEQERKELNKDKLIDLLEGYIKADLGLGDDIFDNEIQLKQELEEIINNSYETKKVKCVKYGVK